MLTYEEFVGLLNRYGLDVHKTRNVRANLGKRAPFVLYEALRRHAAAAAGPRLPAPDPVPRAGTAPTPCDPCAAPAADAPPPAPGLPRRPGTGTRHVHDHYPWLDDFGEFE